MCRSIYEVRVSETYSLVKLCRILVPRVHTQPYSSQSLCISELGDNPPDETTPPALPLVLRQDIDVHVRGGERKTRLIKRIGVVD